MVVCRPIFNRSFSFVLRFCAVLETGLKGISLPLRLQPGNCPGFLFPTIHLLCRMLGRRLPTTDRMRRTLGQFRPTLSRVRRTLRRTRQTFDRVFLTFGRLLRTFFLLCQTYFPSIQIGFVQFLISFFRKSLSIVVILEKQGGNHEY